MRGLYIHIPFCVSKCAYCDFYSLAGRADLMDAYVKALFWEAAGYGRLRFQTLFMGGGTPSLLGADRLGKLMAGLNSIFQIGRLQEATLEANPESATLELPTTARNYGFDRVSIGVQSLFDTELAAVGRIHTADQAIQALETARQAGFKNISADVILGLPGQTSQTLATTLETLSGLGLPHISVYCLALEPHTPLAQNRPSDLPSEETQADLYAQTVELLEKRGYAHYEISNFARPGFECRHNLNYWQAGEYVGLGPAAASYYRGCRFKNRADLEVYLKDPNSQMEDWEKLTRPQKAVEEAILRLRLLKQGLNLDDLIAKYGDRNVIGLAARLNQLSGQGHILRGGAVYRLNPQEALVSNSILCQLVGE